MSLYPSLEDMKVDQLAKAQVAQMNHHQQAHHYPPQPIPSAPPTGRTSPVPPQYQHTATAASPAQAPAPSPYSPLYPSLQEYMGLEFTPEMLQQLYPEDAPKSGHLPYPAQPGQPSPAAHPGNVVVVPPPMQLDIPRTQLQGLVAPLSGNSVGLRRAEVTHGVRELVLCKDRSGKVGLRVKDVSKGVFVALVRRDSPAALAGLRFGDQILQINGENVAGYSVKKVHNLFIKLSANDIRVSVRDRPFERTITLHKDSVGHIGFAFKNGKIDMIVRDSSAARNGLLIDHYLLEVNGQNVVGLKDKDTTAIIDQGGNIITVTIMPAFLYEHMIKNMHSSLVKDLMDHSIPEL